MVRAEQSICQYVDEFIKLLKFPSASRGKVPFALHSFILTVPFTTALRGRLSISDIRGSYFPGTFSFYLFANATFSFHSSPVSLLLYFLFAISFFFLRLFSSVSLYSACFYPSLITLEKEAVSHDPWCIRFVVMILSASLANIELFLLRRSINCRQHSVIICALSQQNKDVQGRYLQAYYHIRNTVPVSSSKVWAQMMQFTLIFSSHSQATVFTWR